MAVSQSSRSGAESGDSAKPSRGRPQIVTSTGWRVVGSAASLVSESSGAGLRPPDRADELLFAANFRVHGRSTGNSVQAVLGVLDAMLRPVWDDLAPLRRDVPAQRTAGRIHAMRWDCDGERDRWTGELLWRHPHATIRGVACTTQLIIAEQPGAVTLGVRVGAAGGLSAVRGMVGAGQARPAFLVDVARAVGLTFDGHGTAPVILNDHDIDDFVDDELLSETREYPVALLAPTETGEYLVPPEELAAELIGIAPLFVLARHPTTFRLTDALGDRRLSAYWGAFRVYMPGFSCADWSDQHPLLRNDVIGDPVMRAEVAGKLAVRRASGVSLPAGVDARRCAAQPALKAADVARPTAPADPRPTSAGAAAAAPAVEAAMPASGFDASAIVAKLDELAVAIGRLAEVSAALSSDIVRLRTTSAVRAAGTSSLERRLTRLDQLLRQELTATRDAPDAAVGPANADTAADHEEEHGGEQTLAEVVRQAGVAYADTLLVLDAAERSAADSPYEDVDRAAVILEAMSLVAQRRRDGQLGMSLRDAFRDFGIDYRRTVSESTPKKLRQQYMVLGPDGVEYDCAEHIVLGGSYDPRHCLRIYFTSRAAGDSRFVIGHVGRHFDVISTT